MNIEQKIKNRKPDIRHLYDMKEVIYDKEWLKTASNTELYYMYRSVKKKNGLVYDITVIPPRMLGQEFIKTKGHEHYQGTFQELYIVLKGQAIFLAQKQKRGKVEEDKSSSPPFADAREIEDVFAVQAKKGEVVIIPEHYGHVTINPSQEILEMANWVDEKCKGVYDLFEKMQGACYYYTQSGWLKNKNYKQVPELRFEKPLKSIPSNLNFLKHE